MCSWWFFVHSIRRYSACASLTEWSVYVFGFTSSFVFVTELIMSFHPLALAYSSCCIVLKFYRCWSWKLLICSLKTRFSFVSSVCIRSCSIRAFLASSCNRLISSTYCSYMAFASSSFLEVCCLIPLSSWVYEKLLFSLATASEEALVCVGFCCGFLWLCWGRLKLSCTSFSVF
jgi:hypothetical protein